LSAFVSFVSESILLGFKAGAALSIAATQLPKLFGVPDGGDHLFGRLSNIVHQLGNTNITVLGIGVVAILILALGEELLPGRPVALFVAF
jgi:MFS superfamily sulfate permease-like transporter